MRTIRLAALLSLVLLLLACSRTGTVTGQIVAETAGAAPAAPRARVWLIPASDAFHREWQPALEAMQAALRPAVERQRAAERLAQQARQRWDRGVAAQGASGVGLSQWNRSAAGRRWERELWAEVQRTAVSAFDARQRVLQGLGKHSQEAQAVLARYASRQVVADESGRYVLTHLRTGKAYLFASLPLPDRDVVWFRPIDVQGGMQQVDLSERQAGGWPFAPGA